MIALMQRLVDAMLSLLGHGGAQTKKLAYLLVVAFACVWLTIAVARFGITSEWVAAFGLLLTAVTSGYLGGKAVENKRIEAEAPVSGGGSVGSHGAKLAPEDLCGLGGTD